MSCAIVDVFRESLHGFQEVNLLAPACAAVPDDGDASEKLVPAVQAPKADESSQKAPQGGSWHVGAWT